MPISQGRSVARGSVLQTPDGTDYDGSSYDAEELEFLAAMAEYQRKNRRRFPAYTEVLAVAKALGYRRVESRVALPELDRRPFTKG